MSRVMIAEKDAKSLGPLVENMADGISQWQWAAAGIAEAAVHFGREERNRYYQEYFIRENTAIDGVTETLAQLSGKYDFLCFNHSAIAA